MSFRVNRRVPLGKGTYVNLGKRGVSAGRRGKHGSLSVGPKGPGGSVRVMRGISWLFGRGR